jgi:predicted nucleic acid-binding protein
MDWLGASVEEELFLSVLSLGEIKKGIENLAEGKRKARLHRDYVLLRSRFSSRILTVTDIVAERWGDLAASAVRRGQHLHAINGLIAATAVIFGMTLVTRNVDDSVATSVPVVNPWT